MINLRKQEPKKTDDSITLSQSNYQKRTTQLDNTVVKIDPSKLSVLSKEYLGFKNIFGFRPLIVHPTVTSCLPYQAAREKRQQMIMELLEKRAEVIKLIEVDIKDKVKAEVQGNIEYYSKLYNEEGDAVKKMTYQSMIDAEKRFLRSMEHKKTTETNLQHPDLIAIDEKIERLKQAQLHIKNGGTCQSCGVTLPDSMEKHIDFVTAETRLLCPFCHLTEHIDEAAELRAGYIGYMPNLSQEQINLFTYCYFILKYILEIDENLPNDLKERLRKFATSPISKQVEDITYEKLYQSIKSIRQAMKQSGNTLIEFFKYKANIDKAHLAREFEEKNDTKIEGNIEDYLAAENSRFEDRKFTFESDNYFSYNIDNMNLPEFYAGIMIANGVSSFAPTSIEEKLNVITRLDGIRFVPSYTFFKPYLDSWQKQLLTTGFEAMMADFFVSFEDIIALKKAEEKPAQDKEKPVQNEDKPTQNEADNQAQPVDKKAEQDNKEVENQFEQQTQTALANVRKDIQANTTESENESAVVSNIISEEPSTDDLTDVFNEEKNLKELAQELDDEQQFDAEKHQVDDDEFNEPSLGYDDYR